MKNQENEIEVGIELARKVAAAYHRDLHLAAMTAAGRAILLGRILLALKKLIRKEGHLWIHWAEENLTFLSERSMERAMLLGSRPDCWEFKALGEGRLELLVAATKNVDMKKDPKPIKTLLKKYQIHFSEDSEEGSGEFKRRIDAALNAEKLEKNQLSFDFESVKTLTFFGVKFDRSLIVRLLEAKATGGTEDNYLKAMAMNKGKVLATEGSEKRFQDPNTLFTRLLQTLQYLTDHKQLEKVIDRDIFSRLYEKLEEIKGMFVLDEATS